MKLNQVSSRKTLQSAKQKEFERFSYIAASFISLIQSQLDFAISIYHYVVLLGTLAVLNIGQITVPRDRPT